MAVGRTKQSINFSGTKYLQKRKLSSVSRFLLRESCSQHILLMELNDRVIQDVAHVKLVTLFDHFRVLVHHQPADVGEEESTIGIVWISRGFRELVVNAMIANPIIEGVLAGQRVAQHQYHPQWCGCFVRSMTPQSVCASGHAQATDASHHETCVN